MNSLFDTEITAEYLNKIASEVTEKMNIELNFQTELWIKNYFLNILMKTAEQGKYNWTSRILYNCALGTRKFESYDAPPLGLNIDLIETKLKQLGFEVDRLNGLFTIKW